MKGVIFAPEKIFLNYNLCLYPKKEILQSCLTWTGCLSTLKASTLNFGKKSIGVIPQV